MSNVFSEYELKKIGFKFKDGSAYETAECIGSCEEEMDVKVVTKSCRGVVKKKTVRGTGTGTLTISLHMPKEIYDKAYGMNLESLIDGVKAHGQNSVHANFSLVADVFNEDGEEKLKAYPNCIIESALSRSIENGGEEVAEIELEIAVMPDDYGNGMYEALASELSDTTLKNTWMTTFTPDLVQVDKA